MKIHLEVQVWCDVATGAQCLYILTLWCNPQHNKQQTINKKKPWCLLCSTFDCMNNTSDTTLLTVSTVLM